MQFASFCSPFHTISSHSHIIRKQSQRTFLHYSCYVTMINIVKRYLWMKIHELNTLIGLLMILSHKHRINIISKIACCRITTGGSFCSFVKFCMHGFLFFRKPFCTHILFSPFFSLQSKKSSIRFWATSWVSVLK